MGTREFFKLPLQLSVNLKLVFNFKKSLKNSMINKIKHRCILKIVQNITIAGMRFKHRHERVRV